MAKFDTSTDFSVYPYSELLEFLNNRFKDDTEDVNYAHVLLTMNTCSSISDCIKIYKRVYAKIQSFLRNYNHWLCSLDEKLNLCYNENMIRLLQENKVLSNESAYYYLANLRKADNLEDSISRWSEIVEERGLKNYLSTKQTIVTALHGYESARADFIQQTPMSGTNAYSIFKSSIKNHLNILNPYGRKILPYDIEFLEDEEHKANIFAWSATALLFLLIFIFGGWKIFVGVLSLMGFFGAVFTITKWIKG